MKKFLNFITFLIVASLPCYADNPTYSTSDNYCPTISIATLNKDTQNLKRFFKFCKDMEWIKDNPTSVLSTFKQKNKRDRYHFKAIEINLILSKAESFHDFYYLLLHTGIRATDAYKLTPDNFKLTPGKINSIQL